MSDWIPFGFRLMTDVVETLPDEDDPRLVEGRADILSRNLGYVGAGTAIHDLYESLIVREDRSFKAAGLMVPGTLILTADGDEVLIGDINLEGGGCGCCGVENLMVEKYRILGLTH
jgi:hypothetical protein